MAWGIPDPPIDNSPGNWPALPTSSPSVALPIDQTSSSRHAFATIASITPPKPSASAFVIIKAKAKQQDKKGRANGASDVITQQASPGVSTTVEAGSHLEKGSAKRYLGSMEKSQTIEALKAPAPDTSDLKVSTDDTCKQTGMNEGVLSKALGTRLAFSQATKNVTVLQVAGEPTQYKLSMQVVEMVEKEDQDKVAESGSRIPSAKSKHKGKKLSKPKKPATEADVAKDQKGNEPASTLQARKAPKEHRYRVSRIVKDKYSLIPCELDMAPKPFRIGQPDDHLKLGLAGTPFAYNRFPLLVEREFDPNRIGFMDFPLEIRIKIYTFAFDEINQWYTELRFVFKGMSRLIEQSFPPKWTNMPKIGYLHINKQIRAELLELCMLHFDPQDHMIARINDCHTLGCSHINEVCFQQSTPDWVVRQGVETQIHKRTEALAYVQDLQVKKDRLVCLGRSTPKVAYVQPQRPLLKGHMPSSLFFAFQNYRFVEHADFPILEKEFYAWVYHKNKRAGQKGQPVHSIDLWLSFDSLKYGKGTQNETLAEAYKEYFEWVESIVESYILMPSEKPIKVSVWVPSWKTHTPAAWIRGGEKRFKKPQQYMDELQNHLNSVVRDCVRRDTRNRLIQSYSGNGLSVI